MKESRFISENINKWKDYEKELLKKPGQRDPEKLSEIFTDVTDDLSYARTFYTRRSVRVYLNVLSQKVMKNIYRSRKDFFRTQRRFWTRDLPVAMFVSRRSMLISLICFTAAFLLGWASSVADPEFLSIIVGDNYVAMTEDNIEKGDPMAVYKDAKQADMFFGITLNNLIVSFRMYIMGFLASVGTVLMLVYNGVMLGSFMEFFYSRDLFGEALLTVWIHGAFEISAIVIAGGAGIKLGEGLLFPGTFSRFQALQVSARESLKIFVGIVPIIIMAGFFESFMTRLTETSDIIRALFILMCFAFIVIYYVWMPRRIAAKIKEEDLVPREPSPENTDPIMLYRIRELGEVFADALLLFKRIAGKFYLTVFALSAAPLLFYALFFLGSEGFTNAYESLMDITSSEFSIFQIFFLILSYSFGIFNGVEDPLYFVLTGISWGIILCSAYYIFSRSMSNRGFQPEISKKDAFRFFLRHLWWIIILTLGIRLFIMLNAGLGLFVMCVCGPVLFLLVYVFTNEEKLSGKALGSTLKTGFKLLLRFTGLSLFSGLIQIALTLLMLSPVVGLAYQIYTMHLTEISPDSRAKAFAALLSLGGVLIAYTMPVLFYGVAFAYTSYREKFLSVALRKELQNPGTGESIYEQHATEVEEFRL